MKSEVACNSASHLVSRRSMLANLITGAAGIGAMGALIHPAVAREVEAKKKQILIFLLNGGLRSSKHIRYYPDDNSFYVLNLIDDSEQELTESQILDSAYSNIGEAMKKGALIMD